MGLLPTGLPRLVPFYLIDDNALINQSSHLRYVVRGHTHRVEAGLEAKKQFPLNFSEHTDTIITRSNLTEENSLQSKNMFIQ